MSRTRRGRDWQTESRQGDACTPTDHSTPHRNIPRKPPGDQALSALLPEGSVTGIPEHSGGLAGLTAHPSSRQCRDLRRGQAHPSQQPHPDSAGASSRLAFEVSETDSHRWWGAPQGLGKEAPAPTPRRRVRQGAACVCLSLGGAQGTDPHPAHPQAQDRGPNHSGADTLRTAGLPVSSRPRSSGENTFIARPCPVRQHTSHPSPPGGKPRLWKGDGALPLASWAQRPQRRGRVTLAQPWGDPSDPRPHLLQRAVG